MKRINKILCLLLGHKYRFNITPHPNRCICKRCHSKWKTFNYIEWVEVNSFPEDKRTDEELIKKWLRLKNE